MPISEVYNSDCLEGMKAFPDKFFDLAVVDPEYGSNDAIGVKNGNKHSAKRTDYLGSQSSRIAAYKLGFDFWGWEIDQDYFNEGCQRFENAIAEPLFEQPKQLKQAAFI